MTIKEANRYATVS